MALGAAAIRAGKAIIELGMPTGDVEMALKKLEVRAKRIGEGFKAIGRTGLAVGGTIVAALAGPIKAASDLEETMNKFNVVFGAGAQEAKAWGDEFAKQIGRSRQQIADFLAGSQDLFVPLGFDSGEATRLSKEITQLAIDLASFNNMADADTLRDLHAALTGSGEVMKKYGVIVSEAAVKQRLFNDGIDPTLATDQQKVMARLNIILDGTTAAQGDAERSAGSFANQMKALTGTIKDASAEIGNAILPAVTELVTKFVGVARSAGEWIAKNQQLVVVVGELGLTLAAASAAVYAIGTALTVASTAVKVATLATKGLELALMALGANPMIILLGVLAAAIAAIAKQLWRVDAAAKAANTSLKTFSQDWQNEMQRGVEDQAMLDMLGQGDGAAAGPGAAGPATREQIDRERLGTRNAENEARVLGEILGDSFDAADVAGRLEDQFARGSGFGQMLIDGARDAAKVLGDGFTGGIAKGVELADGAAKMVEEKLGDLAKMAPDLQTTPGGIFSAQFAAQQFGGQDIQKKQLTALENIEQNTKGGGGIPVV